MRTETSSADEIAIEASETYNKWLTRFFWKRRLPGFRDTSNLVRRHIHELTKIEKRRWWWGDNQYIGIKNYPIPLKLFILQVQKIREAGLSFNIDVIHHPSETKWVSDGGKHDNWETFEDCHTKEKIPEFLEFRLYIV